MEAIHKVTVISDEREGLRPMLLALQTSIHRSVFAFVTAAGAIAGLYWSGFGLGEGKTVSKDFHSNLMFLLTQLEFLLGLLVVGLLAQHNVAARYLAALEMKVNLLADDTITAFESSMAPRFYHQIPGVFWLTKAAMLLFLIALFVWAGLSAMKGRDGTGQCLLIVTLLVEITVVLTLLVLALREGRVAQSLSERLLGLDEQVAGQTPREMVRDAN